MVKRSMLLCSLLWITVLVFSACGQAGTAATATPTTSAVPTVAPTAAPLTSPTPVATLPPPEAGMKALPAYPADLTKKYVAEGFSLPGMGWGLTEQPQFGGTAVIANRGDLPTDDPMKTGTSTFAQPMAPTLGNGSFIRPKPENNFEAEGWLAESWQISGDAMAWTFKLRPDIKWHDGVQFNAEEAKFWIDLAAFPPKGRKLAGYYLGFGPLKEVQVVDNLTVKLVMKDPAPNLLEVLYTNSAVVSHPKHLVKPLIDAGNVQVGPNEFGWVSVGPFKVEKYEKGASIKHVRFDQFFEKDANGRALPYLDAITYPFIPDPNVMVSAFRAGKLDGTARGTGYHLTPDMTQNIRKSQGDKAWFMRFPYVSWSANLNSTKPPFNDIRVRQALHLYVDRQEATKLVYGGYAIEGGIMAPGSQWADPGIREWAGFNPDTKKQDQAEAKRLLKEAGLEGAPVTITCRDIWQAVCEFLDLSVRGLGMQPKVEIMDINRMTEVLQAGNYQVTTRSGGAAHPGQLLEPYLTSNPLTQVKTGDPYIDDLSRQIATTVDPKLRLPLVRQAEAYIIKDKAYDVYWFFEEAVIAYRTYMKGIYTPNRTVQNNNYFASLWIDKSLR